MSDLIQYKINHLKVNAYSPEMIVLPSYTKKVNSLSLPSISSFINDLNYNQAFSNDNERSRDTYIDKEYTASSSYSYLSSPYKRTELDYNNFYSNIELAIDEGLERLPIKPKRKRAGKAQIKILNQIFSKTPFPSTELRSLLSHKLRMSPRAIQIWFQNKRQISKN